MVLDEIDEDGELLEGVAPELMSQVQQQFVRMALQRFRRHFIAEAARQRKNYQNEAALKSEGMAQSAIDCLDMLNRLHRDEGDD